MNTDKAAMPTALAASFDEASKAVETSVGCGLLEGSSSDIKLIGYASIPCNIVRPALDEAVKLVKTQVAKLIASVAEKPVAGLSSTT